MNRITKNIVTICIMLATFWVLISFNLTWLALTLYFLNYGLVIIGLLVMKNDHSTITSNIVVALSGYKYEWAVNLLYYVSTSLMMYFTLGFNFFVVHLILCAIIKLQVEGIRNALQIGTYKKEN